jgi:DNA-binding transcriptional ArsR family regulator
MPHPDEHSPATRPLERGEADQIAERMAAFATASRLKLLYALVGRELSVEDLADESGVPANAVSQQLRILRHLRLVTPRRDGRRMLYRLHDDHLVDLLSAIRHQLEHARHGWSEPAQGTRRSDDVRA